MRLVIFALCWCTVALAHGATSRPILVQDSAKRGTAIVFVHGGGGNARDTWRHSSAAKSWPEWMVGDEAFRDTTIFVHDYPSPYLDAALNIHQLGVEMHAILRDRGILDHERVVFVAHSMGGLVVKSFLLTFRQYLPKVRFVYFLGVPSKGTEVTRYAHLVSRNPQPREVASLEGFLQQQLTQWRVMHSPMPLFPVYCAYEELPTAIVGAKIVELSSAVEGCFEAPEAVLADHVNMVKPRDRDTTTYVLLRDKYRKESQRASTPAFDPRQMTVRERAAGFLTKGLAAGSGNPLGAIEMYSEAIRIDPTYERAFFWRAQAFAMIGNRKRAAEDFRRALELKLDDPQDRALARHLLDQIEAAERRRPPRVAEGRSRALPKVPAAKPPITPDAQAQVQGHAAGLFATEDAIRARAAARLAIEWSEEPWVVPILLDVARNHTEDRTGVMSTIALLETIGQQSVRLHGADVESFLNLVAALDPRLADRATQLRALVIDRRD